MNLRTHSLLASATLAMLALHVGGCNGNLPSSTDRLPAIPAAGEAQIIADFSGAEGRPGTLIQLPLRVRVQGAETAGYALRVSYLPNELVLSNVVSSTEVPEWSRKAASSGKVDLVLAHGTEPNLFDELTLVFAIAENAPAQSPVVIGPATDGGIVSSSDFRLIQPDPVSGVVSVTR